MAYQIANPEPLIERFTAGLTDSVWSSRGRINKMFVAPRYRDKAEALKYELIEANRRCIRWIVIDVDQPDAVEKARALKAPPNFTLENDKNGHAHLFWLLARPVWLPKKKTHRDPKRVWFMKSVRSGLNHVLGGDPSFTGRLTKNPVHDKWTMHTFRAEPYDLADICEKDDIRAGVKAHNARRSKVELDNNSRNCSTFNALSGWAHRNRSRFLDEKALITGCEAEAQELNAMFQRPLPMSELAGIAKSVARGVWRYQGPVSAQRCNRGAARVDASQDARQRQQKGQEYAAGLRRGRTWDLLRSVVGQLADHAKPTQKRVAEIAGVALSTVKRYWRELTGGGRFREMIAERVGKIAEKARNVKAEVVHVVETVAQVIAPKPQRPRRPVVETKVDPVKAERLAKVEKPQRDKWFFVRTAQQMKQNLAIWGEQMKSKGYEQTVNGWSKPATKSIETCRAGNA